jgi:hypothetical protein
MRNLSRRQLALLGVGAVAATSLLLSGVSVFRPQQVRAQTPVVQGPSTVPAPVVIDLGHVQIVAKPSLRSLAPAGALPPGATIIATSHSVSVEQADQSVAFSIVLPTWLPSPTYELTRVDVLYDSVTLDYRDTSIQGLHDIMIREQPWSNVQGQLFISGIPGEGTIDGRPAAYWTQDGTPMGPMQEASWERGDLLISFTAPAGVTPDIIRQIAESLTEQSPIPS